MSTRTFIIRQAEDGYYSAAFGEHFAGDLGFDECLGVVAAWLLQQRTPYTATINSEDPIVELQKQVGKRIEDLIQIEEWRRNEMYRKMREKTDHSVPF